MVEVFDELYVGGEWRKKAADFPSEFPYTGEPWARFARGDPGDIDDAIEAARRALGGEWGDCDARERADFLQRLAARLRDQSETIAMAETRDNGKPIRETRAMAKAIPEWFEYFAAVCRTRDDRVITEPGRNAFVFTRRDPVGVVGMITPYNSPLMLGTWKLAPALAAGATVVLKPSKLTPASTLEFAKCVDEVGFPAGVVNVITGTGSEVGSVLAEHPDLDKISFTGGTDVGRTIASAAGTNIVPLTLELGGKSANIIFEDAVVENAINDSVPGVFKAAGQSCTAGSRLLVQEAVYEEVVERVTARVSDIRLGDPREEETEMGPIGSPGQIDKIESHIRNAKSEGATLTAGGARTTIDGCNRFVQPTVLSDVTPDMTIAKEEVFGPVLSIIPFTTEEEAVAIANDTEYGLAGGLWTEDYRRAHRIAGQLEVGRVWVNLYKASSYAAPQGGRGQSGYGTENGQEAIDEYASPKSVWMNLDEHVGDPYAK